MGRDDIYQVRMSKVGCLLHYVIAYLGYDIVQQATDLGRPYWIYIIPTDEIHQWLLLQFLALLMKDAENVRNT